MEVGVVFTVFDVIKPTFMMEEIVGFVKNFSNIKQPHKILYFL